MNVYYLPDIETREQQIERIIEEAEQAGELKSLDVNSLKQSLISFEKKMNKNQMMRMKHPNDPEKFMDSEVDLNSEINDLYALAASPELYTIFVENGSMESVLSMLAHENTDISICAIGLLQELMMQSLHLPDLNKQNKLLSLQLRQKHF